MFFEAGVGLEAVVPKLGCMLHGKIRLVVGGVDFLTVDHPRFL